MATKTFKYGHLFSTSASTLPNHDQMTPGEIGFIYNETDNVYKIFADQGTKVVDLGAKIGGKGDEKTIDTQLVNGDTIISSLVYIKEITGTTLPANVHKRYALVNAQGENVVTSANTGASISSNTSEYIDVYKDSSIVEIYEGTEWDTVDEGSGVIDKKKVDDTDIPASAITPSHTAVTAEDFHYLNYVYYSGGFSGSTSGDSKYYMTQIDLSRYLTEGEFASGVTAVNGTVTGVVDSNQDKLVIEWSDGDATAAGTSATTASGLTVGEDGFSLVHVQEAIDAKHANTILMNGYTSGVTEDLFGITSGLTIMQSIKKIEDKLCSNGNGKPTAEEKAAGTNNTGLLFVEDSDETVILNAGTF